MQPVFTDTHTHLYAAEFGDEIHGLVTSALQKGVTRFFLPNIDKESLESLWKLVSDFPENMFPMSGLHPTSVKADYAEELSVIEAFSKDKKYYAVGEIGIDLYWDKTFQQQQETAFLRQVARANAEGLPIVIHSRESFDRICDLLEQELQAEKRGIFHCFTGDAAQARRAIDMGYHLGIGGVVTYKNSTLPEVLKAFSPEHLVLETDAPYLPPVPHRGKRNDPEYILLTAEKLCTVYGLSLQEIANITTANSQKIFGI